MRKTLFAFVFSVCAGAASASNILNASGIADTALTAVNMKVYGDAVGVWGQAINVDPSYGAGTGVRAEGLHTGVDIMAGPGQNYGARGVNINASGAEGEAVWGVQGAILGTSNLYGVDMDLYGNLPTAYRAYVVGENQARAFEAVVVTASNGNAHGLLTGGVNAFNGNAYGADLGQVQATNGYGWAIDVDVNSDLNAHGFSADYITSNNGDAYGVRLHSVTAANASHGVSANAYGNNVTYGGAFYGGSVNGNGYGIYANGYSANGDGYGIYANAGSSGGTPYAGVFNGDVLASGSVCWPCSPSDEMFKKNVKPMTGGLNTIMALKPKTYDMKADEFKDRIVLPQGRQRGFLAQELQAVVPEVVKEVSWPAALSPEEIKNGVKKENLKFKAVNYTALIPILVEAVQEQQAVIKALEDKVARLEAR
jgi:hypothetical protein